jgi:hypothetical protein
VVVHLIALGRGRYDLYAEPAAEASDPVPPDASRIRRWIHAAGEQWQQFVGRARAGEAEGAVARWRDRVICRLADSIDEQRTLWALRRETAAEALYPAGLEPAVARTQVHCILARAQHHHGWWLAIDFVLFIASGILFFIPGPNNVAYNLGFRTFGHLQSWRGARQGSSVVCWTLAPSAELAELAALAADPPEVRASRVEAIAARLGLAHLPGYFARAAA